MIGIHDKFSLTHLVGLGTTKMDVLFEVMDKTQTTDGVAKGATARPWIQKSTSLHKLARCLQKLHEIKKLLVCRAGTWGWGLALLGSDTEV